jgi:hypothetical protein
MSRNKPVGKANAAPTSRFKVRDGWRLEIVPLTFGRARIIHTDGVFVQGFW